MRSVKLKLPVVKTAIVRTMIMGFTPLVVNAWTNKADQQMQELQKGGTGQKRKGKDRPPRDYAAEYESSKHLNMEGEECFSTLSLQHALVRACTLIGFKMTIGKMAFTALPDSWDARDGMPLTRIQNCKSTQHVCRVRLPNGSPDIRSRAMYAPGWKAMVAIEYDTNLFNQEEIIDLLVRAGEQCGIHEGRKTSPKGVGCGWGMFSTPERAEQKMKDMAELSGAVRA